MVKRNKATSQARHDTLHYPWLSFWLIHECRSICQAAGQMLRVPFTSLVTILVIAITIAVPLSCFVFIQNLQHWQPDWSQQTQLSMYLKNGASNDAGMKLTNTLRNESDVLRTRYISPEEGMQTFKKRTGLNDALDSLNDNPLPGVIVITPAANLNDQQLESLRARLVDNPLVESVKIDLQWVKRLHALLALGQQSTMWLGLLLMLGVLLIIGNSIISTLQQYQDDIQVYQLLGASHAFIRQPFMMMGALYGLLGGISAWVLVSLGVSYIQPSVDALAAQYQMQYQVASINIQQGLLLLAMGCLLGLIAARITVFRYLTRL